MTFLQKLGGWLWDNPVTLKELRIGLREKRIFILQVLFLFLLLALSLVVLPQMFDRKSSQRLADAGREFFYVLFWVQLLLLSFTMPALTCGSLSGERERNSLDMVLASRLSSGELVAGKLGFAAYCLVLLLASALPLASISFFLGGVSLAQALSSYVELFLFGMIAASIGLFSSARENRSNYSTVQAYLLVLVGCCSMLPLYAVLRYDESSFRLQIGPYGWTGNEVWELTVFHFFVGLAVYFISFLFTKARHRLRPQASNLRAMALSFIAFYLFCLAWVSMTMVTAFSSKYMDDSVRALACAYYLAHLVSIGFFLNPPRLESSIERDLHARSALSKPWFWLSFLGLGLWVPPLVAFLCRGTHPELTQGAGVALFLLLVYPVNVLLVQRLFVPNWRFGWVFYLGLLLLHFLPALGAFNESNSVWRLFFVSPLLTLIDTMSNETSRSTDIHAVLFQLAILALLAPLSWWHTWRSKRPPQSRPVQSG
jgi:ABC-type transport system involved in multi-copper enzyme maturation permease subunit